jgi:hypothetical protein
MQHDGRYHQTMEHGGKTRISAFIFSSPETTALMENPEPISPLPGALRRQFIRLPWFDISQSLVKWSKGLVEKTVEAQREIIQAVAASSGFAARQRATCLSKALGEVRRWKLPSCSGCLEGSERAIIVGQLARRLDQARPDRIDVRPIGSIVPGGGISCDGGKWVSCRPRFLCNLGEGSGSSIRSEDIDLRGLSLAPLIAIEKKRNKTLQMKVFGSVSYQPDPFMAAYSNRRK